MATAQDRFRRYVEGDAEAIHPNLRSGVFSAVIAHGGQAEFDQLQRIYEYDAIRARHRSESWLTPFPLTNLKRLCRRDRGSIVQVGDAARLEAGGPCRPGRHPRAGPDRARYAPAGLSSSQRGRASTLAVRPDRPRDRTKGGESSARLPVLQYSEAPAVRTQDVPFLIGALSANPKVV